MTRLPLAALLVTLAVPAWADGTMLQCHEDGTYTTWGTSSYTGPNPCPQSGGAGGMSHRVGEDDITPEELEAKGR